ncbi:hypothetical protein KPH14_000020, partial [Odynerus spinipes]
EKRSLLPGVRVILGLAALAPNGGCWGQGVVLYDDLALTLSGNPPQGQPPRLTLRQGYVAPKKGPPEAWSQQTEVAEFGECQ